MNKNSRNEATFGHCVTIFPGHFDNYSTHCPSVPRRGGGVHGSKLLIETPTTQHFIALNRRVKSLFCLELLVFTKYTSSCFVSMSPTIRLSGHFGPNSTKILAPSRYMFSTHSTNRTEQHMWAEIVSLA